MKRFTTSLWVLAAVFCATRCSSDAPKAKQNDASTGESGEGGETAPQGGTGLCGDGAAALALEGGGKASFVALSVAGVVGEGKAAAAATKARLALPQLSDPSAAHFEAEQTLRPGYNVTVGMLPPGKYDLTVTLVDAGGASVGEGTACLQIGSNTDYVLALESAAGSALDVVAKTHASPGNDPFANLCTNASLLCDTPATTAELLFCTIPAKGDTPTGFNALAKSECLGANAVIRASCTSRAIAREDFDLVSCGAPAFSESPLDAEQVLLNHLWNEKDGVKCGGFDVSYVVETGHVKVGLCASPDAAGLTWSTMDLTSTDKVEFEALLAKLDGSHADGAFCDGGYQDQLDATAGQGLVDTPYVVFKRAAGKSKVLAAGDFAGACAKFKPDALEAVLSYLRGT